MIFKYTKNIFFKSVSLNDSEIILTLRNNPQLNQFISPTLICRKTQDEWLENYLKRYKDKKEFYFKILDYKKNILGVVRIYNINYILKNFTWGSWIMITKKVNSAAIETILTLYEFAFVKLKLKKSFFDVKNENIKVINIHKKTGAYLLEQDSKNHYFSYDLDSYINLKKKFIKYIKQHVRN